RRTRDGRAVDLTSTDRWTPRDVAGSGGGCRGRVLWCGRAGRVRGGPTTGIPAGRRDDGVTLSEVDPRRLALLADGLEVLGPLDVEDAGDDVARHRLDLGVEVA